MKTRHFASLALSLQALQRLQMHDTVAHAETTAVAPVETQPTCISREALITHYAKFPDPQLTPAFHTSLTTIKDKRQTVIDAASPAVKTEIITILDETALQSSHHGLDSTMYNLRCACEEAAQRVEMPLSARLLTVANRVESFQMRQRAHATAAVEAFLPQDFRKTIFDTFRNRSERADADAVRELMENGGTVREKYQMLWHQQWRRREALASIGNATGIWKWLVRVLAGVPEPLLTFAREINAPNGPTEALRLKFNGVLGQLAGFAVEVNALLAADEADKNDVSRILEHGLDVYEEEIDRFVQLLEQVITNSPFFVPADAPQELEK